MSRYSLLITEVFSSTRFETVFRRKTTPSHFITVTNWAACRMYSLGCTRANYVDRRTPTRGRGSSGGAARASGCFARSCRRANPQGTGRRIDILARNVAKPRFTRWSGATTSPLAHPNLCCPISRARYDQRCPSSGGRRGNTQGHSGRSGLSGLEPVVD